MVAAASSRRLAIPDENESLLSTDIVKRHRAMIQRLFQYYCSLGDPMNHSHMRSNKFIKFLKEAGLMAGEDLSTSQSLSVRQMKTRVTRQEEFFVPTSPMTVSKTRADIMFKKATGIHQVKERLSSIRSNTAFSVSGFGAQPKVNLH